MLERGNRILTGGKPSASPYREAGITNKEDGIFLHSTPVIL